MTFVNLRRRGGKKNNNIIWKGNLSRKTARNSSPFFSRSHPELKWKVTFSMLGRVCCVAPPGMARPVCNYNPCWESWVSRRPRASSNMEMGWAEGTVSFIPLATHWGHCHPLLGHPGAHWGLSQVALPGAGQHVSFHLGS